MTDGIPTEMDWADWRDDLDQRHAHEIYAGRSNEEMQDRFVMAPVASAGELEFMPAKAFRYYMLGFRDSVLSGKHDDVEAANAASCFIRLVQHKLATSPEDIEPIAGQLMPALEYIAENQGAFDAEVEIFGDFRELVNQIKADLAKRDA